MAPAPFVFTLFSSSRKVGVQLDGPCFFSSARVPSPEWAAPPLGPNGPEGQRIPLGTVEKYIHVS